MAVVELKYDASARELRLFTALWLPAAFALFGLMTWWASGALRVPVVLWTIGAALGLLGTLSPTFGRVLFIVWMTLTYPIGWVMSHLLLGVIYFLVITPIALVLRATGRDPLELRFDRGAKSYWIERKWPDDVESYFRGF